VLKVVSSGPHSASEPNCAVIRSPGGPVGAHQGQFRLPGDWGFLGDWDASDHSKTVLRRRALIQLPAIGQVGNFGHRGWPDAGVVQLDVVHDGISHRQKVRSVPLENLAAKKCLAGGLVAHIVGVVDEAIP